MKMQDKKRIFPRLAACMLTIALLVTTALLIAPGMEVEAEEATTYEYYLNYVHQSSSGNYSGAPQYWNFDTIINSTPIYGYIGELTTNGGNLNNNYGLRLVSIWEDTTGATKIRPDYATGTVTRTHYSNGVETVNLSRNDITIGHMLKENFITYANTYNYILNVLSYDTNIPIFADAASLIAFLEAGDDSGQVNKEVEQPTIDVDSWTTNIDHAVYDSSIPALTGVKRVYNGRTSSLHSYSGNVTFSWSDTFNSEEYYIHTRTTFRYKLNRDTTWSTVTIDTSVPTGRCTCYVDAGTFTYSYGDYAALYWQEDDSIWTTDNLDEAGNIQTVKDSIRIVKIDSSGNVAYGPWTTFTLKNNVWDTGVVEDIFVNENLTEDNTGGTIPEQGETSGDDLLTQFDFTNVVAIWENFLKMITGLMSFIGRFPDLFAKIFSFLPYEIRNTIYLTFVSLCGISLIKAVLK